MGLITKDNDEARTASPTLPVPEDDGEDSPTLDLEIEWRPLRTVEDLVSGAPLTVSELTPLPELVRLIRSEGHGALPITDRDQRLCGIVTDHDLVFRGYSRDRPTVDLLAMHVMTLGPHHVRLDDSVEDLVKMMNGHGLRWIPVVDDDHRVAGLISLGGLADRADRDPGLRQILADTGGRRSLWHRMWH